MWVYLAPWSSTLAPMPVLYVKCMGKAQIWSLYWARHDWASSMESAAYTKMQQS